MVPLSEPVRLGVDVGGTNTHVVAMSGSVLLGAHKVRTADKVEEGVRQALSCVLQQARIKARAVSAVMVGTTYFANALIEAKNLAPVAVVRLSSGAGTAIPPFSGWPQRLRALVEGKVFELPGGYEFDGREMQELDESLVRGAAQRLRSGGVNSIAVSGIFSQLNPDQEDRVCALIKEEHPSAMISRSHELGRLGMLERENATILNASLAALAPGLLAGIEAAVAGLGIHAPVYISQNDGTLSSIRHAASYPILTFASGPTNSMRGAAFLTGHTDALVADIGGTTTDVGVLKAGFPRESPFAVDIGGVRINFRMPDIVSVGVGGGSRIVLGEGEIVVGPASVAADLNRESLVFGGKTLTATDAAVRAGVCAVGSPSHLGELDQKTARDILDVAASRIGYAVDQLKSSDARLPLIVVGGASFLAPSAWSGVSETLRPANADVANAIGASLAQAGGEVDVIVRYAEQGREAALSEVTARAVRAAVDAGASAASTKVVDIEEVPLSYVPGGAVRIRARAVGDIALKAA